MVPLWVLSTGAGTVLASKNDGGALIVHTDSDYQFSAETACAALDGEPVSCEAANPSATKEEGQVVWLLAAFDPSSNPGVSVVYFGLDYDPATLDPVPGGYGPCAPAGVTVMELPGFGWPEIGGTSVTFYPAIVGNRLFAFYVIAIDGGGPGSFFGPGENPDAGYAAFVDDGDPPGMDIVERFGTLRWGEPGSNSCPVPARSGACCLEETAICQEFLVEADCVAAGGTWSGTGTNCATTQCGACCYWNYTGDGYYDRSCVVTSRQDCEGGARWGERLSWDAAWDSPDTTVVTIGPEWAGAGMTCRLGAPGGWECEDPRFDGNYGACCVGDVCTTSSEEACEAWGRSYLGTGTRCEENPCVAASPGACCSPGGSCVILTASDCRTLAGSFQGAGVPCDPNPCPGSAVRKTSWGRIKAGFR